MAWGLTRLHNKSLTNAVHPAPCCACYVRRAVGLEIDLDDSDTEGEGQVAVSEQAASNPPPPLHSCTGPSSSCTGAGAVFMPCIMLWWHTGAGAARPCTTRCIQLAQALHQLDGLTEPLWRVACIALQGFQNVKDYNAFLDLHPNIYACALRAQRRAVCSRGLLNV